MRSRPASSGTPLFAITGTEIQPIMTAPKLMWIRDELPEVWSRTSKFLNVSAYIAWRLGAEMVQEHSLASRTGLFDLRRRDWHPELLKLAGLDRSLFGTLTQGGTRIGSVSRAGSLASGLPAGIAIGMAGHDHLCGAFAGGVIRRGDVLDSIGTAEGLLVGLDTPVDDVTMGGQGFTQGAHVVPDQYYGLGAIYTAGASYEWARKAFAGGRDHQAILAGARSVSAGSLGVMFLPHLRLAMFPELDSRARGAFIGLTTDVTTDVLIRAVLEGVAMEGRAGFGPLAQFADLPELTDIKVIGGTARNQLLIEIKASVMNARQHVLAVDEATALGAAMLAGMAAGVYSSADDAIAQVSYDATIVEPDSSVVALYDAMFNDVYRHIYHALRPMHHAIFDMFIDNEEHRERVSYLGIDLGTSSVKVVVVDDSGGLLASTSAAYPTNHPVPGAAEQNPDDWWNAVGQAVRSLPVALRQSIVAVGLSGQMHGTVCLGADLAPLRPAIIWSDTRGSSTALELTARIGKPRLADLVGTSLAAGFQAVTIAWLHQHERTTWQSLRIGAAAQGLPPISIDR